MSNREMFFLVISTILIYELQWMGARELPTSASKRFSSSGVNKLMLVNSNEESEDSPNSEAEEDEDWERDSIEESKDSPSEEEAEKEDDTTEGNPKGVSGESSDSEEEEDEPSEDDIALGSDDYPDSEFEENEPTEEDFEDESEVEEEEEPTEEDFDEESEDSETEEDEPAGKRGFRRHRYKIFLTEDVRPIGITANLLSHRRGGCQKLLRIVRIYGNNALARVFLKCGRLSKFLGKLWLRLVIIRRNSGDRFLNSGCNINDRSSDLGGKHGGRDSDALLRLNNHEAGEAREEMMAAVKVEKYLKCAMNRILKVYNRGGEKFFLAWRINTLFSQGALRNLARRHSCEQRKVEHCPRSTFTFRTIDGTCNNIRNPLFGSAPGPLNRLVPAKYFDFDGLDEPIGFPGQVNVPNIPATLKVVQRFIIQQNQPSRRPLPHSHLLMQFGQFLDHDVGLSPESQCSDNCQGITIDGSADDFAAPCYSIQPFGNAEGIHFARSASECQIKNGRFTKREQINVDTSFVDASQVYGSGKTLARDLRDLRSKGLLKTTPGVNGKFLPEDSIEREGPARFCHKMNGGRGCFLAGDSRTNEQLVLTSMHTLFVREHNRIARALGRLNPGWDGEKIYQETRKIVGAVLQKITYQDFLPIIIGNTLPRYRGYNPNVNPDLLNAFSTAAFRFGHTLIRPTFDVLDKNFNPKQGVSPLPLAHLFFNTSFLRDNGIDGLLLGLLANSSENFDQKLATPLLKQLFERPDSPGLNLAALNIQRSRDHGLPGYNAYRHVCGLKSATSFWSTRREIQSRLNRICLRRLYGSPKNADLFVAGLGEAPANGGIVGATFGCIIREQFRRLRDGDRFFYKKSGVFTPWQLREINKATMSRIMCDNLKNIVSVQRNAFFAGNRNVRRVECAGIPRMNLRAWRSGGTSRRIRIYIRSEGCRDRRRTGSGRAFIRINGIDYSRHSNGYNIVVINGRTGRVEQRRSFFTRSNFAANRMVDFLKSLRFHRGKFVLVAIQRDGSQGLNFRVRRALRGIGAGAIFRSQCSSFALIGRSGGRGLVAQVQRGRWRGPSVISRYIYLQR